MTDGDVAIFCNFRSDRAREITRTLTDPSFDGFHAPQVPQARGGRLSHNL